MLRRSLFAAAWVALQLALVASAAARPDRIFGFRMFSESTTVTLHLWRRTDGGLVPAAGGVWLARDRRGVVMRYDWRDFVAQPELAIFDARLHAPYGRDAELARLQAALDYVAAHVDDAVTEALVLDVELRVAGRAPTTVRLTSHARP